MRGGQHLQIRALWQLALIALCIVAVFIPAVWDQLPEPLEQRLQAGAGAGAAGTGPGGGPVGAPGLDTAGGATGSGSGGVGGPSGGPATINWPGSVGLGITGTCGTPWPWPTMRSCSRNNVYLNEPMIWLKLDHFGPCRPSSPAKPMSGM